MKVKNRGQKLDEKQLHNLKEFLHKLLTEPKRGKKEQCRVEEATVPRRSRSAPLHGARGSWCVPVPRPEGTPHTSAEGLHLPLTTRKPSTGSSREKPSSARAGDIRKAEEKWDFPAEGNLKSGGPRAVCGPGQVCGWGGGCRGQCGQLTRFKDGLFIR